MLGQYMTSPGFGVYGNHEYGLGGTMMSLQDVTRAKFGQPGVDAIVNYPFLVKAKIDDDFYMKEDGTARPAATFSLYKKSDNTVAVPGITGREKAVEFEGKVIYSASGGGNMMPLLIGGGIAAAVVIGIVAMKMM
jgi:hypothetical protein